MITIIRPHDHIDCGHDGAADINTAPEPATTSADYET
jgi:hypothetical protein